jgi:hypothetical protein
MKRIPCLYAIAQFSPFVETGEFANVGLLLLAPEHGYFGFKLLHKRYARVTRFFPEMDRRVYLGAMAGLQGELERVNGLLDKEGFKREMGVARSPLAVELFNELTRPRETLIRFGRSRATMAETPPNALEELYGYYVERNFAKPEYGEKLLEKQIRGWLDEADLGERFQARQIGDKAYHASFPFVETLGDEAIRVIKPLRLDHDEPSRIRDHGLQWVTRMNELRQRNHLPRRVLFAVQDAGEPGERQEASMEIEERLEGLGLMVAPFSERLRIVEFAQGQELREKQARRLQEPLGGKT